VAGASADDETPAATQDAEPESFPLDADELDEAQPEPDSRLTPDPPPEP
jgi:hypothetical protein